MPSGSPSTVNSLPATQVSLGGVSHQRIRQLGAWSRKKSGKRQKSEEVSSEVAKGAAPEHMWECLGIEFSTVRSNIDSGAAVSVAPRGTFVGYPIVPSSESTDLNLVAANGETVRHYGEVHPVVVA